MVGLMKFNYGLGAWDPAPENQDRPSAIAFGVGTDCLSFDFTYNLMPGRPPSP